MPSFHARDRTVESYLAGIGASSALLVGPVIVFVILVGVATFESWPRPGSLFPGGGDDITLDAVTGAAEEPALSNVPNLAKLLGGGEDPSGSAGSTTGGGTAVPESIILTPGGGGPQSGGGQVEAPRGDTPPQAPAIQIVQPPTTAPTPPSTSQNAVQQTVSTVGNTVESTTTALGDNLSTASPTVGGLVDGLGQTVNDTLQGLAGND